MFERLVLFHRVVEGAPARAMYGFLAALSAEMGTTHSYLQLVRAIYAAGPVSGPCADAWQDYLLRGIIGDENPMSQAAAAGRLTPEMVAAAAHDLRLLQNLFSLTGTVCRELAVGSEHQEDLPVWPGWPDLLTANPAGPGAREMAATLAAAPDWGALAQTLADHYQRSGAGLTGAYWYLRWEEDGLQGIAEPYTLALEDLVGLEEAKETVLRNTEQFLRGAPANNLLLYGNRGTGKSTMVRSLALRHGAQGLRLIDVGRSAMATLPALFRLLKGYPQRFLLFLDDLSFDEGETDYKAFKSLVEGALEAKPANVLLYATSNRRHLVPERWSDRHTPDTAEVHGQDAMEEKLSLADRFGITVLFPTPGQEEYLAIVRHMAHSRGLSIGDEELREAALRWVMWHNPRSGRAARQFVDDLAGRLS